MGKVHPIAKPDKVKTVKPKPKRDIHSKQLAIKTGPVAPLVPERTPEEGDDIWVLKDGGVSREKLKQLGAGKPPIDIEVDLHGLTRDEAIKDLERVMQSALSEKFRVLCIVHGRGLHSQGKPVLKEAVYEWLRSGPHACHVLAVIPKPYTGGGSALVLLRRSRNR